MVALGAGEIRVGVQASDPDLLDTPRLSRILGRLAQQGEL